MNHFTFPSDQDRADNDELERVFDQLEQCLVENDRLRDALAERDALLATYKEKLEDAEKWRDLFRNAEQQWETGMMEAIGEDGVGSVSAAIRKPKGERDQLAAHVERLRDLADYWIGRGKPGPHPSESEFRTWHSLGYGSAAWRETPVQSLAAIRANATERLGKKLRGDDWEDAELQVFIADEAQRLRNGEA